MSTDDAFYFLRPRWGDPFEKYGEASTQYRDAQYHYEWFAECLRENVTGARGALTTSTWIGSEATSFTRATTDVLNALSQMREILIDHTVRLREAAFAIEDTEKIFDKRREEADEEYATGTMLANNYVETAADIAKKKVCFEDTTDLEEHLAYLSRRLDSTRNLHERACTKADKARSDLVTTLDGYSGAIGASQESFHQQRNKASAAPSAHETGSMSTRHEADPAMLDLTGQQLGRYSDSLAGFSLDKELGTKPSTSFHTHHHSFHTSAWADLHEAQRVLNKLAEHARHAAKSIETHDDDQAQTLNKLFSATPIGLHTATSRPTPAPTPTGSPLSRPLNGAPTPSPTPQPSPTIPPQTTSRRPPNNELTPGETNKLINPKPCIGVTETPQCVKGGVDGYVKFADPKYFDEHNPRSQKLLRFANEHPRAGKVLDKVYFAGKYGKGIRFAGNAGLIVGTGLTAFSDYADGHSWGYIAGHSTAIVGGGMAGGWAGAIVGAAAGSTVAPGPGTAIGAGIGGAAGAGGGAWLGDSLFTESAERAGWN